jgi:hypothetical protein
MDVVTNYYTIQCRISIRATCTTFCDNICQWIATGRWFSPGPPISSTDETDRHDITEILLIVALSTIKLKKVKIQDYMTWNLNHIMNLICSVSIVDIVFVVWSKIDGVQNPFKTTLYDVMTLNCWKVMKASVFSPFFLLCQLHGTMQEFIDGRIHQMNFGFLCRTYKNKTSWTIKATGMLKVGQF